MAQPYTQPCDRGVILSEPCPREAEREPDAATKRWTLAACVLASSMAFIDGSALTVALPQLRADLGANIQAVQWVLNGYVLALAALTLVGGALADRYGRRDTLIAGCIIFAMASAACALAPNAGWLIAARLLQGVGAAILTPASLALIGAVFPKDERNAAIGTWAAASALTTVGGPVLGGWLTETFGWESIFWINPPLALLAVTALWTQTRPGLTRKTRFDFAGALTLAAALGALAFALSNLAPGEGGAALEGATEGPPAWLIGGAGILAIGLGALFWAVERRGDHPMLPAAIFRGADFNRLNLATLLIYAGLSIMFFLLPFELVDRRGLTATQAGLAFLPFTIAVGLLSRTMGGLADRFGPAPLLVTGPLVAAIGFLALAFLREADLALGVVAPMALLGLGFALVVAPLTATVMSSVAAEDTGLASGINNTASRIAQLIGVALATGLAAFSGGYAIGLSAAAALSLAGAAAMAGLRGKG